MAALPEEISFDGSDSDTVKSSPMSQRDYYQVKFKIVMIIFLITNKHGLDEIKAVFPKKKLKRSVRAIPKKSYLSPRF